MYEGGEEHVAQWSPGVQRRGWSRGDSRSGQERTGQVMTLLVVPTRGLSCHSRYMSREGFYL